MKKKLKDLTAKEIYTTCDKHNAGNKCSRDCPFFLTERIHKCTTSYMKKNPNEEIEISFTMTDREYAQYLFDWLRFDSSEDVCAKCANCPKDDFCPKAEKLQRRKGGAESIKQYCRH